MPAPHGSSAHAEPQTNCRGGERKRTAGFLRTASRPGPAADPVIVRHDSERSISCRGIPTRHRPAPATLRGPSQCSGRHFAAVRHGPAVPAHAARRRRYKDGKAATANRNAKGDQTGSGAKTRSRVSHECLSAAPPPGIRRAVRCETARTATDADEQKKRYTSLFFVLKICNP